jgi:SAM-dependent methyltransferase
MSVRDGNDTTPAIGDDEGVDDPKRIIEAGYDQIGEGYRPWSEDQTTDDVRDEYLREVLARLPGDADVLELGCGPGVDAALLARGRRYVGVDLSRVQLGIAHAHVPEGTFLQGDLTRVEFRDESFDAVMSVFVFNHVPSAEQAPAFRKIHRWLRPGGFFCASLGGGKHDDSVQEDWLGVPMFFASNGYAENVRLLAEAGFRLERSELRTEQEDDGEVTFHWVIARKPSETSANEGIAS